MKDNFDVSVLMCIYSEPLDWIEHSINSILEQTYTKFEFIIVNDNPTRNELNHLLEKYRIKDSRIILINNIENIGLTKSLNNALKIAQGHYIVRMDADDIALPNRILEQHSFMEKHQDIGVCGSWTKHFGESRKLEKRQLTDKILKNQFLDINPFIHPTTMIRTDILTSNGITYNSGWKYAQDKQIWFELYDKTKFANIPKVLLYYRVSKVQVSHKNLEQKKLANKTKLEFIRIKFGERIYDEIVKNKINLETIKNVKKNFNVDNTALNNSLIENLYLSITEYSFAVLAYCILSGDLFAYKIKIETLFKILKRVFKNSKYDARIIVN